MTLLMCVQRTTCIYVYVYILEYTKVYKNGRQNESDVNNYRTTRIK